MHWKTGLLAVLVFAAATAQAQDQAPGSGLNEALLIKKLDGLDSQNKALIASLNAIQTQTDDLRKTLGSLDRKLDTIAACGARQKLWDGQGCMPVPSTVPPKLAAAQYTVDGNTQSVCASHGYDVTMAIVPVRGDNERFTVTCLRSRAQ